MEIQPLDIVVAAIIAAAMLRGFFVGLVREAFSIAALWAPPTWRSSCSPFPPRTGCRRSRTATSVPASRRGSAAPVSPSEPSTVVILLGRGLQRTLRAAGLNWADRVGGGLLGAAEGVLVAGILLVLGAEVLGRDHPAFSETVSLAAIEEFERLSEESEIDIDVAAPPRTF